jgi:hypothetical protein
MKVFDRTAALGDGPKLHAFIAGVSAYEHLPKPGTLVPGLGLTQLDTAARSAWRVYQWLLAHQDDLSARLATVHLLLTPNADELAAVPELAAFGGDGNRCSRGNFEADAMSWRELANGEDLALFYFAGHGIQRSRRDGILLLDDFKATGPLLAKAVEVNNLVDGLAIGATFHIPRRQLFFIDSCRVQPAALDKLDVDSQHAPILWDVPKLAAGAPDDRDLAVYYAAMPGAKAYARPGEESLFSTALVACLDGAAAQLDDDEDAGRVPWVITAESLAATLRDHFPLLARTDEKEVAQAVQPVPQLKTDILLRTLPAPPPVAIEVTIDPPDALGVTAIAIESLADQQRMEFPPPVTPHPLQRELAGGAYRVNAEITDPASGFRSFVGQPHVLRPPRRTFVRRVRP